MEENNKTKSDFSPVSESSADRPLGTAQQGAALPVVGVWQYAEDADPEEEGAVTDTYLILENGTFANIFITHGVMQQAVGTWRYYADTQKGELLSADGTTYCEMQYFPQSETMQFGADRKVGYKRKS